MRHRFDAVVIGAGADGLFTAAGSPTGPRTLVVERLDKVGRRASTDDIGGSRSTRRHRDRSRRHDRADSEEVGAPFDIREPRPALLYRSAAKTST